MANERLRAALLQKGVSIADLAAAIEVDPKTVERWVTKGREPYRKHRFATASYLGVDEAYLWPDALSPEQVTSASQSEIIAIHPHRWAVPRDIWGRLFGAASEEIGVLVYSGLFLADDGGMVRLFADKARAGVRVRILLGDPDSAEVAQRGAMRAWARAWPRRSAALWCSTGRSGRGQRRDPVASHGAVQLDLPRRRQYLINMHVYGTRAGNAPVLHLRRVAGGDMVATYAGELREGVGAGHAGGV